VSRTLTDSEIADYAVTASGEQAGGFERLARTSRKSRIKWTLAESNESVIPVDNRFPQAFSKLCEGPLALRVVRGLSHDKDAKHVTSPSVASFAAHVAFPGKPAKALYLCAGWVPTGKSQKIRLVRINRCCIQADNIDSR
jgi:hypothetical protein